MARALSKTISSWETIEKTVEEIAVTRTCQVRAFRVLGDQVRESDGRFSGRRWELKRRSGVFGRSDRPASGISRSGGESCDGRRRRSSGSFQLRRTEGSLSRFYERLAVTRMECVTSLRALYIMSMPQKTWAYCAWDEPKVRASCCRPSAIHRWTMTSRTDEERERFLVKVLAM